ncbi:MAG: hypothetical protein GVY24_08045 [Planctomycetes bacterium]|jgi:hypothetical protein|nr:hypothetical protein [Planctomycetota bacterium]
MRHAVAAVVIALTTGAAHAGVTLEPVDNADHVAVLRFENEATRAFEGDALPGDDRRTFALPEGDLVITIETTRCTYAEYEAGDPVCDDSVVIEVLPPGLTVERRTLTVPEDAAGEILIYPFRGM